VKAAPLRLLKAKGIWMARPQLILVSGAPGSGKSTLARRLAEAVRLPLLMRDELKEPLYDTIAPGGPVDVELSSQLGAAAYALLYAVAHRLLDANVGPILESNFYRGWSEPQLAPVLARSRALLIHCGGDADVIIRRYRERAERGERHRGHNDLAVIPRLRDYLASGRCEPLDLDIPLLRVDTTTSDALQYLPAFDAILAFVADHS
jgi:predicted kinase